MNKSMLMGLIGGIGIATAGGVAGYALMSQPAAEDTGSAVVTETSGAPSAEAEQPAVARTAQPEQTVAVSAAVPATPAPKPAAAPRAPAPAPERVAAAAPAPAPAAAPVQQECWDEVVEVPAEPRDERAIAGTASGAILGGAIARKLGDDNDLLTAAGAAAGAFAGRRLQRQVQENNTTTTVERRCAPAQ